MPEVVFLVQEKRERDIAVPVHQIFGLPGTKRQLSIGGAMP